MSFSQTTASPFWFPDAILLCALLVARPRLWPLIILAPLPIRLWSPVSAGLPLWFLLATFAIDSVKGLLAALLLRACLTGTRRFDSVRDLGLYALIAVLLIPAAAAFPGAGVRHLLGHDFWPAWSQWFLGDALAQLVITPAILYWCIGAPWRLERLPPARAVEASLVAAGLIVSSYLAFHSEAELPAFAASRFYAPIPFLVWGAVRFGMLGATGGVAVLAVMTVEAALDGAPPFAGLSAEAEALGLQQFLAVRAAPLYLVAVLFDQMQHVERTLRESEKRFRTLADTAPMLVWMSGCDKACEFFNKVWLDFTGRTLEQERGDGWVQGVHPEDLSLCLAVYGQSFDKRVPFEMEYRLRDRNGVYRWILDKGVPRYAPHGEFLGYIGCAIDITERREQVAALSDSEERYREVVNTQNDLVCRYRPDTTLTFVNAAYCRYFGRAREELIGTRFIELLPLEEREAAQRHLEAAAAQKEPRASEHAVYLRDGGLGWQHWVDYPIFDANDALIEFQSIGYDITDRKRAEEANRNLAHAARLVAVGELTAVIAHEIMQPLAAILSDAQAGARLVKSAPPPLDEVEQIFVDIRRNDQRAEQAITRIRALARKRSIQLQPLDLNETVSEVLQLAGAEAVRRQARIISHLDEALPCVAGDRVHLQQVVLNLIVNAMDAMSETDPAARQVTIATGVRERRGRREVLVRVIDRGHGIPADQLARIFESFFTTKPDGIGLGLAVSRSIIQAHGGRIWAANGPQGGAIFQFALPALEGQASAQLPPRHPF